MQRSSELPRHRRIGRHPRSKSVLFPEADIFSWPKLPESKGSFVARLFTETKGASAYEDKQLTLTRFEELRAAGRIFSVSYLINNYLSVFVVPEHVPLDQIDFKNSEANGLGDEVISYSLMGWNGKQIGVTQTCHLTDSDAREAYEKMLR